MSRNMETNKFYEHLKSFDKSHKSVEAMKTILDSKKALFIYS